HAGEIADVGQEDLRAQDLRLVGPGLGQQRVDRLQHLAGLPGDVLAGVLRHLPGQVGHAVVDGHLGHARADVETLDHGSSLLAEEAAARPGGAAYNATAPTTVARGSPGNCLAPSPAPAHPPSRIRAYTRRSMDREVGHVRTGAGSGPGRIPGGRTAGRTGCGPAAAAHPAHGPGRAAHPGHRRGTRDPARLAGDAAGTGDRPRWQPRGPDRTPG